MVIEVCVCILQEFSVRQVPWLAEFRIWYHWPELAHLHQDLYSDMSNQSVSLRYCECLNLGYLGEAELSFGCFASVRISWHAPESGSWTSWTVYDRWWWNPFAQCWGFPFGRALCSPGSHLVSQAFSFLRYLLCCLATSAEMVLDLLYFWQIFGTDLNIGH